MYEDLNVYCEQAQGKRVTVNEHFPRLQEHG